MESNYQFKIIASTTSGRGEGQKGGQKLPEGGGGQKGGQKLSEGGGAILCILPVGGGGIPHGGGGGGGGGREQNIGEVLAKEE